MLVRNATLNDLPSLIKLHDELTRLEKLFGCVCIHPASPDFIRGKLADAATTFLVADHDGSIVAFAYGTLNGDVLELQNVFVEPDWRMNGLARELLSRLFADERAQRARVHVLKKHLYNAFWTHLGFKTIREIVNAYELELDLSCGPRDVRKVGLRKNRIGSTDSRKAVLPIVPARAWGK